MARVTNPNSTTISETVDGSKVEVISDQSIETPATIEFGREMAEEAFMSETMVIRLAETTDENARPYADFSVNGVNQPILRGVETRVKRKFVEAMARCKESKYTQKTMNPMEPDRIEMNQRTAAVFPFEVLEDKNPKGRAWLNAILLEAA